MSEQRFSIEEHDGVDKSFEIIDAKGEICMKIDYDCVDHIEVDATAKAIVDILNAPRSILTLLMKQREYFIKGLKDQWDEESDLQDEYPDVKDYINQFLGTDNEPNDGAFAD